MCLLGSTFVNSSDLMLPMQYYNILICYRGVAFQATWTDIGHLFFFRVLEYSDMYAEII